MPLDPTEYESDPSGGTLAVVCQACHQAGRVLELGTLWTNKLSYQVRWDVNHRCKVAADGRHRLAPAPPDRFG